MSAYLPSPLYLEGLGIEGDFKKIIFKYNFIQHLIYSVGGTLVVKLIYLAMFSPVCPHGTFVFQLIMYAFH